MPTSWYAHAEIRLARRTRYACSRAEMTAVGDYRHGSTIFPCSSLPVAESRHASALTGNYALIGGEVTAQIARPAGSIIWRREIILSSLKPCARVWARCMKR